METSPPIPYHLPTELWRHVIRNFVLKPLELGHAHPNEAFISNRAALRQLCLTSRRFVAIARPYLYESIVVSVDRDISLRRREFRTGVASLVLLMRTMVQNHALRPLVKHLALPVTLTNQHPGSSPASADLSLAWLEDSVLFSNLHPTDQEIFDTVGLTADNAFQAKKSHRPTLEPESLAQKVLASLLCMVNEAETILLQDLFTGSSAVFDRTLSALISHPQLGMLFLPHLSTLQIQLNPVVMTSGDQIRQRSSMQAKLSSPLFNQPKLRRVDMWYAWFDALTISAKALPAIAHIEEMDLTIAANTESLGTVIGMATGLKSLSLGLLSGASSALDISELGTDLNILLLSRSDTLESLALDISMAPAD
jgi:hypothetical protein